MDKNRDKIEESDTVANPVDVIVMRLRDHYNQMAPHVQERETAKLLLEATEQIKGLNLDMSLWKIVAEQKAALLDSCEKALAERQEHVDGADLAASMAIEQENDLKDEVANEAHTLNKLLREHTTQNYNISECLIRVETLINKTKHDA